MKKWIALVLAAGALAASAGQAEAGTSSDARIASLERQVAALTSQARAAGPHATTQTGRRIAALERRVTTLQRRLTQTRNFAVTVLVYAQCLTAATADAFTGTWGVINQIGQPTGTTYFPAQPTVNDFRACSSMRITRQPTGTPSVSVFSALSALIG